MSIEHSSGSDFINQKFIRKGEVRLGFKKCRKKGERYHPSPSHVVPPAMPMDSSPEPSTGSGWLLTGHIRSIGTQYARDGRNSDAEAATRDCYRFGNLSPVEHGRGRSLMPARAAGLFDTTRFAP